MIHYKFLSTALLLGTVMLWSSCSDIEEDFSGTSGDREFIINVHDMGMENGESSVSRAITDMNYNTTFDMTTLLIEHDMKLVSGICEELTVLNFGQVLAQGKT